MKKNNINIFVFILVFLFLGVGMFSKEIIKDFIYTITDNLYSRTSLGSFVTETIHDIESILEKKLIYHDKLLELNSFVLNKTGTEVIEKDDTTVVKMKNGYLAESVEKIDEETLDKYVSNIAQLYAYTRENDIPFLYIMAPKKGYGISFPCGVDNYIQENCQLFSEKMSTMRIPYLDLRVFLTSKGISEEETFFITDHHWKPNIGLIATEQICRTLQNEYGINYDPALLRIDNYKVKTYKNWFLGSYGKKAGLYFTDFGADDFDVITPIFDTSFTVSRPIVKESITGNFEEAHIIKRYIEPMDYYNENPYAAYTGGDYHIQIVENHQNQNGKKILIIRDSFACAVTPFLSLTAQELHILDLRNYGGMVGDRVHSVSSYIEQINPDYVLILYNGVPSNDLMYTFEMES